uniref:Chemotaxis protein, putative n=1 Tax=Neospora caninum (strain Liverpool) TaxID=572307 RepID=A0A0F7UKN6_NEOCL|nr:TPA: chemotaxis protein, putative [Neospora caninum Liverpool]
MPHFVPVYDPEKPRAEQDDAALHKHRRWEVPHAVLPRRQSRHGEEERDERPVKLKPVKSTMVRNAKGLWVSASQAAAEAKREEDRRRASLQKWGATAAETPEKSQDPNGEEESRTRERSRSRSLRGGRRDETREMERRDARRLSSGESRGQCRPRSRGSSAERRSDRLRRDQHSRRGSSSSSRSPDDRRRHERSDRREREEIRDALAAVSAPSGEIDMFDYMSRKQRAMLKMRETSERGGDRWGQGRRAASGGHRSYPGGKATESLRGFPASSRSWR